MKASEAFAGSYDPRNPDDELYGSHLNGTGITPKGYKLLLELPVPADIKRAQASGLEIPETAMDRHTQAAVIAKVIQVGCGAYNPEKFPEGPWCFPGDYVCMSPYAGTRIRSNITNMDYRFVNDDSIDGVIISPEYAERG